MGRIYRLKSRKVGAGRAPKNWSQAVDIVDTDNFVQWLRHMSSVCVDGSFKGHWTIELSF